jgi:hypothetical protein
LKRLEVAKVDLRGLPKPARVALRRGWMAKHMLNIAAKSPEFVLSGDLEPAEFYRKINLLWKNTTGGF